MLKYIIAIGIISVILSGIAVAKFIKIDETEKIFDFFKSKIRDVIDDKEAEKLSMGHMEPVLLKRNILIYRMGGITMVSTRNNLGLKGFWELKELK